LVLPLCIGGGDRGVVASYKSDIWCSSSACPSKWRYLYAAKVMSDMGCILKLSLDITQVIENTYCRKSKHR
jgi:hypothetical protein